MMTGYSAQQHVGCDVGRGADRARGLQANAAAPSRAAAPHRAADRSAAAPHAAAPRTRASRIRAAVRVVVVVAVCLVLGFGAVRFVTSTAEGDALPMPFGFGVAVVMSGSMSPALEVDDLVVVRPQDSYAVGDIVVYESGNSLVTHRVVGWEDGMLIAQGDANNAPDAPIDESAVQGAVVLSIPHVGAAVGALKTPAVLAVILLGAFALIGLSFRADRHQREAELDNLADEVSRLKIELATGRDEESEKEGHGSCKAR